MREIIAIKFSAKLYHIRNFFCWAWKDNGRVMLWWQLNSSLHKTANRAISPLFDVGYAVLIFLGVEHHGFVEDGLRSFFLSCKKLVSIGVSAPEHSELSESVEWVLGRFVVEAHDFCVPSIYLCTGMSWSIQVEFIPRKWDIEGL